jgi:hypothetical protein
MRQAIELLKTLLVMMQQLNLDRVTDPAKWEPIRAQSNLAAETYASHVATKDELGREQVKGIFAMVRHSLVLAEKMGRLFPPALLAVRFGNGYAARSSVVHGLVVGSIGEYADRHRKIPELDRAIDPDAIWGR